MTAPPERPSRSLFGDAGHDAKHEAPRSGKRTPLRVLIVGSSEDDVLLLLDELKCGGYEALYEQVQTLGEMEEALARESWDLVLADHHASLFSATGALVLLRQRGIDLPLIVVSGEISGDVAVALMKDGARDYVSKDDLARLMPAIERELREAENRRKKKLAEKALNEAEVKYRNLFENAVEGIFQSTTEGRIRLANPALARILGYPSPEELITSITDIAHEIYAEPDRREEFFEQARRHGSVSGFEVRTLRKDGSVIWVSVNARVIYDEAGEIAGFEGLVQDITERKRVEEDSYENEERFRSLVQHAADIITILESDGTIRYESPAIERVLGYQPEELIGQNAFDYVHRDDLERLASVTGEVLRDPSVPSTTEFRFRSSDGSWRLLEAVIRGLSDGNGAGEVVVNARDVTERKQAEKELRQSEELYRNVLEQAAENIFLVDVETRRVLEANSTFHRSLGYSAEELQNLTLYDFIDHDGESIDWNAQRILKEGHAFLGERKYRRKDSSLINVEVSASVVSYSGKNVMCVVAHDVTERKRIEEDLKRSLGTLLALREAGQILGSTLESEEIASRLLEIMRGVSGLTAAVISREDERGQMRVWRAAGIERLWKRARFAPEAEDARRTVLETGEHQVFWLRHQEGPETEHLAGMCLPLRMRERLTGVLEAYGPESLGDGDAVGILNSLAAQAASALENALLYEELAEREKRLEGLVGKLFVAQEEERRRVAYEVHDGLAQVAVAAHQ
ncbi:MAG: PAS domain S-box protein, partial [Actinobacteria bacterium]|nr:PAS domain S-box protein [Actinomycetota bacterium]